MEIPEIFEKILMQNPQPTPSKRFNKLEECTSFSTSHPSQRYDKMIFLSKEAEEEWNNVPPHIKKLRESLLKKAALEAELDILIEHICKTDPKDLDELEELLLKHENDCKFGSAPL